MKWEIFELLKMLNDKQKAAKYGLSSFTFDLHSSENED
jgi:hypothetical protein